MPRLESRNLRGGLREIRVHAPDAESVELMGDFTGWETVKLETAGGGWWSGSFRVPPGIHELNVRLDGKGWIVPRGLNSRADELGGSVGILIVE
jgi:1,4-alpha-glucan branching enzyme